MPFNDFGASNVLLLLTACPRSLYEGTVPAFCARQGLQDPGWGGSGLAKERICAAMESNVNTKYCDRCRQGYHTSLSVRVPGQGLLELYQDEHVVVAVGQTRPG
jgi:hypothetical protein